MLGDLTAIENAGQLNAYMTLNIRGKRSKTDTWTTIQSFPTRWKSPERRTLTLRAQVNSSGRCTDSLRDQR